MGSIKIAPGITEIDYVPDNVRLAAGDILLTAALIQKQLADLFAVMTGVNRAAFEYLGQKLDTSQTIMALKRLIKSEDAPVECSASVLGTLSRCIKVLEERNKIAHNPLIFIDNMLLRHEVRGGSKPHRVAQVLSIEHFSSLLGEMKIALWELRIEVTRLQRLSRVD